MEDVKCIGPKDRILYIPRRLTENVKFMEKNKLRVAGSVKPLEPNYPAPADAKPVTNKPSAKQDPASAPKPASMKERSMNVHYKLAYKAIDALSTIEDVTAYITGETRKTVIEFANNKLASLNGGE